MTPHDERAPYRQQRWVECESDDQFTFGDCVKIVDSYRPEQGTALTPGGGRTVFQIATPDEDSQLNTIILGQQTVVAGRLGYCTNDFPTYAKCDQNAVPGDIVGPVAGSTTLALGQTGYLVMGDVQGGYARVRRHETSHGKIGFIMLEQRTREQDANGLYFGRALARIQDHAGRVPDLDGAIVEVRFFDRLWLGAYTHCEGTAEWYEEEQIYIVDECQELPQKIWFKLLESRSDNAPQEELECELFLNQTVGNSNAVNVAALNQWANDRGALFVEFVATTFPRALGPQDADGEATGVATLDVKWISPLLNGPTNMRYVVDQCDQMCPNLRVEHDLFCPGADPVGLSDWYVMDFWPFSQRVTADPEPKEIFKLASNGGDGYIKWDESQERWVVIQCELEQAALLTSLRWTAGCDVEGRFATAQIYTCTQPAWQTLLDFEARVYVQQITDSNGCVSAVQATGYFPPCDADPEIQDPFICVVLCSSGSGG